MGHSPKELIKEL